ncbi:hypothetical protein ACJX0J_019596, partial [Zea mays]
MSTLISITRVFLIEKRLRPIGFEPIPKRNNKKLKTNPYTIYKWMIHLFHSFYSKIQYPELSEAFFVTPVFTYIIGFIMVEKELGLLDDEEEEPEAEREEEEDEDEIEDALWEFFLPLQFLFSDSARS